MFYNYASLLDLQRTVSDVKKPDIIVRMSRVFLFSGFDIIASVGWTTTRSSRQDSKDILIYGPFGSRKSQDQWEHKIIQ